MKNLLLLLGCLLCIQTLIAQPIPIDKNLRTGTLDNGMKYFIQKNAKPENRAEIRLAVKVGAVMEDDDQQGLAHFVEHMAFNGTKNFEKNELVHYLESTGAQFGPDLNAYTSFDETVYMLQVRTDDEEILSKGLLIFEDWAGGLLFDGEEIDKERGVIKSEWRSRLSPDQRMQNKYFPVMYHGSKYAERLPIGKTEIIENAPYDALRRYYTDWYRPNLMAIIVVGDFDVELMEAEVRTRFSKLQNPENPRPRTEFNVPHHEKTFVSIHSDKEATSSSVRMAIKLPKFRIESQDDIRTQLTHRLYNGMLNNRLSELRQLPEPPFIFGYCGYGGDIGDIDRYSAFARTRDGELLVGLEAVMTEVERAKRFGFTTSEMEREITNIMTRMESAVKEMDNAKSRSLASRYVYHFLKNNPAPSPDQRLAIYEKFFPTISIDEINALSEKWLKETNRVFVLTAPEQEGVPMPTEDEVYTVLNSVKHAKLEPYKDEVDTSPLFSASLTPGSVVERNEVAAVGIKEWILSNGVKVISKKTDFKEDEVMMRAKSDGGTSIYNDDDYRASRFADRIVDAAGLGDFDAIQLDKKLTGKLVSATPYIGERTEGFRGSASLGDLETMFQLTHLYFTSPREDNEAFQSFITKQESVYKNLMSNPDYYFMDYGMKIKMNNHPRRGFPTSEDIQSIDYEKVLEVYRDRFEDASDFTFYFVGNFDEKMLETYATKYLATLPSTNRKEMWKDVGANYEKGVVRKSIEKGEAQKTQVNLMFHGDFEYNQENEYLMQSMLAAMRIKLREELREEKGGVYGVRASGGAWSEPTEKYSITVSFNAEPERAEELIESTKMVIKKYQAEVFEDKDVDKVSETQRQSMIKNIQENRYWMSKIMEAYEDGYDPSLISIETLDKHQKSLTPENLKMAAQRYFDWNNYFELVMSPAAEK